MINRAKFDACTLAVPEEYKAKARTRLRRDRTLLEIWCRHHLALTVPP